MSSQSPDGRRRTLLLSLVVVLAVAVLALVGFLVFRGSSAPKSGHERASATVSSPTQTPSETTAASSSTQTSVPPTTAGVQAGSVTYQLTGDGDVVALAYRDTTGRVVVAATSTPWSEQTTVSDRDVELTAVVIRGPVTCTIRQGERLISKHTRHRGALRCAGRLPH